MEFVYHSSNQPHVLKMYSTPNTVIDANARYKEERLYLSVFFLDSPIRITWQACLICFLMTLISKQISPVPVSQKRITPFYTNSWVSKNSLIFLILLYQLGLQRTRDWYANSLSPRKSSLPPPSKHPPFWLLLLNLILPTWEYWGPYGPIHLLLSATAEVHLYHHIFPSPQYKGSEEANHEKLPISSTGREK